MSPHLWKTNSKQHVDRLLAEISPRFLASVQFGVLQETLRTSCLSFIIRHVFYITKHLAAFAVPISSPLSYATCCSDQTASFHHSSFKGRDPRRLHPQRRPDTHGQSIVLSSPNLKSCLLTSTSSTAPLSQFPLPNSARQPSLPP